MQPVKNLSYWISLAKGRHSILLVATVMAFSMWFFVDRVWAPPVDIHFSDLYPRWYGSRELLLHGRDPYSPEVTQEIQVWAYGHALVPERDGIPKDEDRFAYPLYVAFVLAPIAGLPFATVQSVFRWILPMLAAMSVALWLAMLRWRCSRQILGALVVLSLFSFPVLQSIYIQQPVLLAAAFLAGSGAALAKGRLWLAGSLLALATIKPQLSVLLALWLLLWAFSDWRARRRLVWGFSVTMLVLVGSSELLLPGWIGEFVAGAIAYQRYTGNLSILALLLTRSGGTIASIGLVIAAGLVTWRLRHELAGSDSFNFAVCLVLVLTVTIAPTLYPTGQVVLLPAVFLVLQDARKIWAGGRASRLSYVAALCLIGWQWLGALACLLASFAIPLSLIRKVWIIPVSTLLLVPLALLVLFAIQSPKVPAPERQSV